MQDKSKTRNEPKEKAKVIKKRPDTHDKAVYHPRISSEPETDQRYLYKSFYEFSPLMNFTVDREGTVRAVNSIGAEHLGYSVGELIGQPVLNVFYPEDRKSVLAQIKHCLNNPNKVHTWEIRKVKKDGSLIWVRENANVTLIGNRKTCINIVCEDITEQRNTGFLLNTENKVLEMITRNSSLSRVLNYLCRQIESQAPGMLCSFLLLDEIGKHLMHGAAPSLPKEYIKAIDGLQIGPSIGSCGTAAYLKKPVIVSDIETDPLWADYKELALKHRLRACWSTPIRG